MAYYGVLGALKRNAPVEHLQGTSAKADIFGLETLQSENASPEAAS